MYPVAEEQLKILNWWSVDGDIWLWILRGLSFLVLVLVLWFWYKVVGKLALNSLARLSAVLILISPLFLVLGLIHPLVCLKLLVFVVGLYLGLKQRWFYLVLVLVLILFNLNVLSNKPAIFNKLNLKDAQTEVTARISTEDSLKESVDMPLWWRRVAYNKYFFTYKQIVAETLPFFDLESVFFQEINPLHQKSIVIFFWPEIYLLILGLYFLVNLKDKKLNNFLLVAIALSWIDFVFSEGAIFKRLVLVIFPISMIVALGFDSLYKLARQKNILAILSGLIVTILILFGWINSVYDLRVRPEMWLDNRPLAFEFWFREIKELDLNKFDKVHVSSLVGNAKSYCYFYLGKQCDSSKFIFESFDLSNKKEVNSVYAGFAGEFVGPRFKNDINNDWDKNPAVNIFAKKTLQDTIANKYGNDIGVGVVQ